MKHTTIIENVTLNTLRNIIDELSEHPERTKEMDFILLECIEFYNSLVEDQDKIEISEV